MATAFMAVDNNLKPKFIKLLKTWDENKIFPDAKIVEVRDTMTLMLTNGGVFPEHLQYGGGQGPQTGAHTHMAQGPMDVETPYMGAHNSYHNQPQHGGSGALSSVSQHHPAVNAHAPHQRPSKSPQPVDVPQESSGPRILCPKELVRYTRLPLGLLCVRCGGCLPPGGRDMGGGVTLAQPGCVGRDRQIIRRAAIHLQARRQEVS